MEMIVYLIFSYNVWLLRQERQEGQTDRKQFKQIFSAKRWIQ